MIPRIGKRGLLNNDFRFQAWWDAKSLDRAEILWNEILDTVSIIFNINVMWITYFGNNIIWSDLLRFHQHLNPF